jgi:CPA1 family monovalent cation:H+ antiporter
LVYAGLPGPNVHLEPDIVLFLVIPPLLYAAALRSSLLAIGAALAAVGRRGATFPRRRPMRCAALRRRADRHQASFSMLTSSDGEIGWTPELEAAIRAQHAVIGAQRDELLRWRDSGRMSDVCFRSLQHELDLEERTLPGG